MTSGWCLGLSLILSPFASLPYSLCFHPSLFFSLVTPTLLNISCFFNYHFFLFYLPFPSTLPVFQLFFLSLHEEALHSQKSTGFTLHSLCSIVLSSIRNIFHMNSTQHMSFDMTVSNSVWLLYTLTGHLCACSLRIICFLHHLIKQSSVEMLLP